MLYAVSLSRAKNPSSHEQLHRGFYMQIINFSVY